MAIGKAKPAVVSPVQKVIAAQAQKAKIQAPQPKAPVQAPQQKPKAQQKNKVKPAYNAANAAKQLVKAAVSSGGGKVKTVLGGGVATSSYSAPVNTGGTGYSSGSFSAGGGSGGSGGVGVSPMMAPAAVSAPPSAAVVPPPVVNPAGPGAGNVGGSSFDTIGAGQGTFGQEQRRRLARGPMTGLSITPEMLRRAAAQRIG